MTIYVDDDIIPIVSNNTAINGIVKFILTSGYSKTPEIFNCQVLEQNSRFTRMIVDFGPDFKNKHKNGVYYYTIANETIEFEKGYAKIITEPGGSINTLTYNSDPQTENREAVVYYRPNY